MSLDGATAAAVAALLSSSSAGESTMDRVVSLMGLVVGAMASGEVQLLAVAWGDTSSLACDDAPLVVAQSDSPNGACPDEWANASCSCLSALAGTTAWTVPVELLTDDSSSTSSSASNSGVLPNDTSIASVTTIGRLFIPADLVSLSLVGQSASPVAVDVVTTGLASVIDGFVVALGTPALDNFEMINVSLATASIDASFVPSVVANITLRNCALSSLSSDVFSGRHTALTFLDLSVNDLSSLSLGLSNATSSSIQFVNLSHNSFASIPADLFELSQLDQLDMRGNPITDVTVTASQLAWLQGLSVFEMDRSDAASCSGGNWTTVHGVSFCVAEASAGSSDGVGVVADGGSSRNDVIYGGIGGGVGLVVLVVLLVVGVRARRRRIAKRDGSHRGRDWRSKHRAGDGALRLSGSRDDDEMDASTLSSFGAADLLSHPLVVMNRLSIADVKVGASVSKGGFGEVFDGAYLGRRVAVKKVHPFYQSDPRRVELFLREIVLMAALQHPRVVEFVGVAWSSLRHLMAVTEFMDRGDLRSVMLRHKRGRHASEPTRSTRSGSSSGTRSSVLFAAGRGSRVDSDRGRERDRTSDSVDTGDMDSEALTWESHKLKWAIQIAEALVYLHSLAPPVIHRDLKSKNVLVDAAMDAKLSDFGISREHATDETHMTTGVGTSFWIAPEVLLGGHYGDKADVFSFGIVLSELDAEDYPYWNFKPQSASDGGDGDGDGASRPRRIHQHAILGMVAAGELRPTFSATCPLGVLQVAERCLQHSPAARPTSTELFHLLQRVRAEPQPYARIGAASASPSASSRSRRDSLM